MLPKERKKSEQKDKTEESVETKEIVKETEPENARKKRKSIKLIPKLTKLYKPQIKLLFQSKRIIQLRKSSQLLKV